MRQVSAFILRLNQTGSVIITKRLAQVSGLNGEEPLSRSYHYESHKPDSTGWRPRFARAEGGGVSGARVLVPGTAIITRRNCGRGDFSRGHNFPRATRGEVTRATNCLPLNYNAAIKVAKYLFRATRPREVKGHWIASTQTRYFPTVGKIVITKWVKHRSAEENECWALFCHSKRWTHTRTCENKYYEEKRQRFACVAFCDLLFSNRPSLDNHCKFINMSFSRCELIKMTDFLYSIAFNLLRSVHSLRKKLFLATSRLSSRINQYSPKTPGTFIFANNFLLNIRRSLSPPTYLSIVIRAKSV